MTRKGAIGQVTNATCHDTCYRDAHCPGGSTTDLFPAAAAAFATFTELNASCTALGGEGAQGFRFRRDDGLPRLSRGEKREKGKGKKRGEGGRKSGGGSQEKGRGTWRRDKVLEHDDLT